MEGLTKAIPLRKNSRLKGFKETKGSQGCQPGDTKSPGLLTQPPGPHKANYFPKRKKTPIGPTSEK